MTNQKKIYNDIQDEIKNLLLAVDNPDTQIYNSEKGQNLNWTRGQILYYLVSEKKNTQHYQAFLAHESERYAKVREDLCDGTKNVELWKYVYSITSTIDYETKNKR